MPVLISKVDSLLMTIVINPPVGCHFYLPALEQHGPWSVPIYFAWRTEAFVSD